MQTSVDKGWSWMVLLAIFCNNVIIGMQYGSVNIFYTIFLQVFDESRSLTSWVGSLNSVFLFSSGSVASYLLPKIGIRNVIFIAACCASLAYIVVAVSNSLVIIILVYGMIGGTGFGFALTGGVAAIAQYFDQQLYMASSIGLVGTGVGGITYGLLLEWLIIVYGWRGATLIFSGVSLQLFIIASMVFPVAPLPCSRVPQQSSIPPFESSCDTIPNSLESHLKATGMELQPLSCDAHADGDCQDLVLLKDISAVDPNPKDSKSASRSFFALGLFSSAEFWCLSYVGFSWGFCSLPFLSIQKDVIGTAGLVEHFQVAIVTLGIANTLSRIIVCFLTFNNILLSYMLVLLLGGIIVPIYAAVDNYWSLLVASFFSGLYLGASYVMLPMSVGAIYGRLEMATTYGYVLFSVGISNLGGPSLVGYLRDVTGMYNTSLYLLGAVQLTGALMVSCIHFRKKSWKITK